MTRTDIVHNIRDVLQRVAPGATVILFGSEARGDAHADSDIDVLILLDKEKITYQDRKDINYPLFDIEIETGILVSPKVFSKKQWEGQLSITPFYNNVMNEGIVLC